MNQEISARGIAAGNWLATSARELPQLADLLQSGDQIEQIARPVLSCRTKDDVFAGLDEAASNPAIHDLLNEVHGCVATREVGVLPKGLVRGEQATAAYIKGQTYLLLALHCFGLQMAEVVQQPISGGRLSHPSQYPTEQLPPTLALVFHDIWRAQAATLVLEYAVFHSGERISAETELALAEAYRDGSYALLRLVSFIGCDVPSEYLRVEDRLDAEELTSTNSRFWNWVDNKVSVSGDDEQASFSG